MLSVFLKLFGKLLLKTWAKK